MRRTYCSLSKSSVALSVCLHAMLLSVLFLGWEATPEKKQIVKPNFVQAKLVQVTPQTAAKVPVENKPNVVDLTKKREQQERLRVAEEQKKKQAQQRKLKEQQEREAKQKAEQQRKREEAERKKQAEAEAERKRLQQQREQQQREQQQREQQQKEQALAEERAAQLEQSYKTTAQSYMAAIAERIERNWNRPPSARNNMQCELLIKLVPTGRVINVDVIKSSGNEQFDRSAVQAVRRVEQFPEIQGMPSEVFERYYRELTLVFNPQDLRQ